MQKLLLFLLLASFPLFGMAQGNISRKPKQEQVKPKATKPKPVAKPAAKPKPKQQKMKSQQIQKQEPQGQKQTRQQKPTPPRVVASSPDGNISNHGYVDLGLPSGLKWATCNVGASSPSDYGDYYAWGETFTKSEYTEKNGKTNGQTLADITGVAAYDVARARWGGSWRLPTWTEFEELLKKCTWTWASQDGHYGYLVKGPNGKSLFLPAAGKRRDKWQLGNGESGAYWNSTPHEINTMAGIIGFGSGEDLMMQWYDRYGGLSVRPVATEETVSPPVDKYNGHAYVDLGLPSGLKWATCNVGASSPSDYGNYYAWGETSPKSEYTESNSTTYGKAMGDIGGNVSYDAARANWGGSWRLPTKAEFDELRAKCIWTWASQGGHNGYLVKGPNGRSIFLPAAGWRGGSSLGHAGEGGDYWSSTPDEDSGDYAFGLDFDSGYRSTDWYYRGNGRTVRAVSE